VHPRRTGSLSLALLAALTLWAVPAARADVLTSADLQIQGASLTVVTTTATVQLGSPALIQTAFGGKTNDDAPVIPGAQALGDLIGPGISNPVTVATAPGHQFQVAGFTAEGVYYLQNIRLVDRNGNLLQSAVPSYAVIQVTNALQTTVTVRQLTPDELRARGITVDPSNYDVYEYTFSFLVDGKTVEIPYPVIINRTTHEVQPVQQEDPYHLPSDRQSAPPRWNPPASIPFDLAPDADFSPSPQSPDPAQDSLPSRPSIHAAIVIPNSLAVLHQFFAVALVVTNGAPAGSGVTLDSITATIGAPNELRIVKSDPAVSFGQPVAISDGKTGATFLLAQAQGNAEWTVEGLKPGTYTLHLDVAATFHSPGQRDMALAAHPSASVVVHDARFNITFSHPDVVNKGVPYTTYTFITNTSDAAQDITLSDAGLPLCSTGGFTKNICRVDGTPSSFPVHLEPGETKSVQYKLKPGMTGHVFATAASIDDANSAITSASFVLDMGVSPTGVPLSPVTLVLPYYARTPYFSQDYLDAQLGLFGIGYGLATAPLTKQTAKFPRVITSDVFTRAVDLARAGERMFIGEDHRDSLSNLALDLLGNATPLAEWDQFRRQETEDPAGVIGRAASAAMGNELAAAFAGSDGHFTDLAQRFSSATAYRAPYVLALAHGSAAGTRPYALSVTAGGKTMNVPASLDSGWMRQIAYGDLWTLNATSETGELALLGTTSGAVDLTITPTAAGTIDLVFPSADGKSLLRATGSFSGVAHVHIENGNASSNEAGLATTPVAIPAIRIVAARQDLHLDGDGHIVSVLFNRVLPPSPNDLKANFDTDVTLDAAKFGTSFTGKRTVAGAALQSDGRIIRVAYDGALSSDVQYTMHTSGLVDAGSPADVVPQVEVRNSALLFGSVIGGDNKPVASADIRLNTATGLQYTASNAAGQFLFEYVPRDPDNGITGNYVLNAFAGGKTTKVEGAVRLLHVVHQVNISFLGRGSARGVVRYDNGDPVPNAAVVVGSTMFNQFRRTTSAADGSFQVDDVPVGPLTFSAQDTAGNIAYAANELHAGGEVVVQDVQIYRKPFPGTGTVSGRIVRNDTGQPVPGTHVGVYSQGYGLTDGYADANGRFQFTKVPSGFVTVLAENYQVAPQSIAVDFDLKPDTSYDTGDLTLTVRDSEPMVAVEGDVTIEDPVTHAFSPVPNAAVQIDGMPVVTADANGHFRYATVPQSFSGKRIRGYDAKTGRVGQSPLPTLTASATNIVPIALLAANGTGTGTVRVHLLNASGQPVVGYHVFEPGYPTLESTPGDTPGVYEFKDLPVGRSLDVVAAPNGGVDAAYGYQFTEGRAGIAFAGQIAAITMRLPGQGSIRGRIQQQTNAGVPVQLAGKLHLTFSKWSDAEQNPYPVTLEAATDGTNDAVFTQVPALRDTYLETFDSVGYASTGVRLGFDGDVQNRTLTLSTLSSVSGRVLASDGFTPVAGAAVHMIDGAQDFGSIPSGLDGSFTFYNVTPGSGFTITADVTDNGIYRTARVGGSTPSNGVPVNNVTLVLMKQGSVEGKVVNDSGAPIPFAKFWLRELDFPGRSFGSAQSPLTTDANGHFRINNVFAVPVRVTAEDPANLDLRGDWNGAVQNEGDVQTPTITIGSLGTGSVTVLVEDPNNGFAPVPNAEVSLFHGGLFDFQTTDITGSVTFDGVPAGSGYSASAYSKLLGKFAATGSFSVSRNTTTSQTIILQFSGEVVGTLTDPQSLGSDGKPAPVPGSNVTLYGNGFQTRSSTGTDGAFDFKGVREGGVHLEARDPQSIRMARNDGMVSTANATALIPLQLEPTSTLTVKAYLPNDAGGSSGTLAPLVSIDVTMNAPGGQYLRSSQTNGAQFSGMVRNVGYTVVVHELGGLNRIAGRNGSFGSGTAAQEEDFVFAAYGSVIAHVEKGSPPVPAAEVLVTANSGGVSVSGYTDGSGNVTLAGLPLGTVSLQAITTGSAPLTGATSVALSSQSVPAQAPTITLGSYNGLTGYVEAEAGGPSSGTRVILRYNGIQLETRTDVTGHYTFQGIVTGTGGVSVALTYLGPDDQTIGAQQSVSIANGAGIVTAPNVKLDSTPPHLISIVPADGTAQTAPDTSIVVTFSRAMNAQQLGGGYVTLYDVGANAQVPLTVYSEVVQPDGSEVVTWNPPPTPPGQKFPLKSNTLYRLSISGGIQDTAGHALGVTVGASFTTSDYSNPVVTKVTPSPALPLPKQGLRFAVTFSKALATAPWQPGGAGVMQLVPVSAIGGNVIGGPVAGTVQLDATATTLYFGPDVTLAPAAFYRLSISGAVDTQGRGLVDASGNPLPVWMQDFRTYDDVAPVATIGTPLLKGTPIGASDALYAGVLYTIPVTLANPDGSAVTDLDYVDFFSVDATGNATKINHTQPLSVDVAIPSGSSFTLRAVAHDLSGNVGPNADHTWQVQSVPALSVDSATITPATIYAGQTFTDTVKLSGGKLSANLTATVSVNGNVVTTAKATVNRATFDTPWTDTALQLSVPDSTPSSATVVVTTTAADDRGEAPAKTSSITLAADTAQPVINPLTVEVVRSSTPSNTTTFHNGDQFRLHALAKDGETGVAGVTFTIGATPYVVTSGTPRSSGFTEFVSPVITVQSHNEDYTVTVTAVAADYASNSATTGTSLTYLGIHDPSAPTVAWITPLHDAAWPSDTKGFATRLSVYAVSAKPLNASFAIAGGSTFTGVKNGNQFDADITIDTPTAGSTMTITAHVDDGDGGHIIEIPLTIDFVAATQTIASGATVSVDASHPLTGDSIVVNGGRLVTHVPVTLKNLLVLNGGLVDSVASTTNSDERIALTVADHFFVDGRSTVDASRRGYLGGLQSNFDGTGRNNDAHGMTLGRTVTGGAASGASATYGGMGGDDRQWTSNATYGSITAPADLGSGGAADGSNRRGGQGGGAMTVAATSGLGKVVVAGGIYADGESGVNLGGAGSGGSIHLAGKTVVLGATSAISATGGDDDGSGAAGTRGGGGGRISIEASTQLDVDTTLGTRWSAHGGRNQTGEGNVYTDGGAGTIFLRYPGEANGELLITSSDSRYTTTTHPAMATVIASAQTFDRVTVAANALARFDADITAGGVTNDRTAMSVDPTALAALKTDVPALSVTPTPAGGGSLVQNTTLSYSYNASAYEGVGSVVLLLDPSLASKVDGFNAYTTPVSGSGTLLVPATATAGSTATFHVRVYDRSGRYADSPAQTYTIAANAAPAINVFDLAAPSPLYIGGTINATVSATDDIGLTNLGLTTQIGSGAPSTQTAGVSGTQATKTFTYAINRDPALDGQTVTLTALANDGFPNRTTTMVKTLTIAHDGNPPSLAITAPAAGAVYNEGAGNLIPISGTVADAESGVAGVTASIQDGETVTLTVSGNTYSGNIHVPSVPDGNDLPKTITVTAKDVVGNPVTATVSVTIHPLYDPTAPVMTWSCGTDGATFPTGYNATLSATVVPGATGTPVDKVTFSDGTTTVTATKNGNVYTATYTVPQVADGTKLTINATATSIGGGTANLAGTITAVKADATLANVTINAGDTTYDNKTIAITGSVTIAGHHDYKRLLVLTGGSLMHLTLGTLATASVDVKADTVYVACGGAIETSGAGYPNNVSYPGATQPYAYTGGAHIGAPVWNQTVTNAWGMTFGSVYRPQEGGGGAYQGAPGGGVVRVVATQLQLEGWIRAAGGDASGSRSGAGGSIWITASRIAGSGLIDAHGGAAYYEAGGGGAVAIEYTDRTSVLPTIFTRGGSSSVSYAGGVGTYYLKGPDSVYGDLTVDAAGGNADAAVLPSLGAGIAQSGSSGATLVTDRSATIPPYFAGNWVEISTSTGTLKGTWRIATTSAKTVTLTPNGSETISVQPGDKWQGVYRFDNIHSPGGGAIKSADPIRLSGSVAIDGPKNNWPPLELLDAISAPAADLTITGGFGFSTVSANSIALKSGGTMYAPRFAGSPAAMSITTTGAFSVDGNIEQSGRGYPDTTTYPSAIKPYAYIGGSHVGAGTWADARSTFGSVYRPSESGGGAYSGSGGGGVVRINAGALALNGWIHANGTDNTGGRTGAGGSIWITTGKLSGSGAIEAHGGAAYWESGAGGSVAIEYTDPTSVLPSVLTRGGTSSQYQTGGTGTLYVKGPSSTYGDLTLDNAGIRTDVTYLPSLGGGTAQSGSSGATLVTDRTADIPAFFAGHWIEISTPTGTLKGTWRVNTISSKTVTLAPNGSETIDVQPGDKWQGVYRFDNLKSPGGAQLSSADPIRVGTGATTIAGPASGALEFLSPVNAQDLTITGNVNATTINATSLNIRSGALVSAPGGAGNPASVTLNVSGALTLDGTIDLTGRGYPNNVSYPGTTQPYAYIGGSHIGVGTWATGTTFGSIDRPAEAGGGAYSGSAGGGVVRITAAQTTFNGVIRVNGADNGGGRTGAGGSVWITTGLLRATGSIEARGGAAYWESGAGGSIAIEYTDPSSTLPTTLTRGGTSSQYQTGGAGTLFVRRPTSTYGDLTIDNANIRADKTDLPSLGSGVALSGSSGATLVTDRTADIPAYAAGRWIEVRDASNALKGRWRIATISAKTVTLAPNGSETINVAPGDAWRGIYRFDSVTILSGNLTSNDAILIGSSDATAALVYYGGTFTQPLVGESIIIRGKVTAPEVRVTNLTVESGASLGHAAGGSLSVKATGSITVASGGAIDASGDGYTMNISYTGATLPAAGAGGSHLGHGGRHDYTSASVVGSTFGNVYQPQELGGGGSTWSDGNGVASGGGRVYVETPLLQLDGAIRANGLASSGAGAGGSVWVKAGKINGNGTIEANGGTQSTTTGGGGAVAVEYTDATSGGTWLTNVRAIGPAFNGDAERSGGPGTVLIKGPSSTYGSLTVDNKGNPTNYSCDLPSLGSGIAQSGSTGATLVTDRSIDIPAYFSGNWVEVRDASNVLKGRWRIATIAAKTVTLAPNGSETISIAPGDAWRGVYRFDSVTLAAGSQLYATDPIIVGNDANALYTVTGPSSGNFVLTQPIVGDNVSIRGRVIAPEVRATNLTIESGAVLGHANGGSLALNVSGKITVASGGAIDVSGEGYTMNLSYTGAALPTAGAGGSHLGHGGRHDYTSASVVGDTYGSVYRPQELGGGGSTWSDGNGVGSGGGRILINAAELQLDGAIKANGLATSGAGAAGSIWIKVAKITGNGTIDADGGTQSTTTGGGGAVAIEYTDAASSGTWLSNIRAYSPPFNGDAERSGGAGTILVKGPASTYGDLTVDNRGVSSSYACDLPSLGSGIAQSGSSGATLVTDRTTDIPAFFAGNWVEIRDAANNLKGRWRIATISARSVTLAPNGSETINVVAGDAWRGIYRFDSVKLTANDKLISLDPIIVGNDANAVYTFIGPSNTPVVYTQPLVGDNVSITGRLLVPEVRATTLTLQSGAVLGHVAGGSLALKVSGKLTIASGSTIDVSGAGYTMNISYPGAALPTAGAGGSHLGRGGRHDYTSASVVGASFGSVYQPQELGGGGSTWSDGNGVGSGGGRVFIQAGELQLDGAIKANGLATSGAGAGGSVWIKAGKITGSGTVDADGGTQSTTTGGGGAVTVQYTDATSSGAWLGNLRAYAPAFNGDAERSGGPGTVLLKGPSSTYGDLTIDNKGNTTNYTCDLPSLGNGIAQSGSSGATLLTDRTTDVPAYFLGGFVQLSDSAYNVKGTWRIGAINSRTITLLPNGSETINVQPGDIWQGVYLFDRVTLAGNGRLTSVDPILANGNTPPQFAPALRAQIVVTSSLASGDAVTGPAGAVSDPDQPVKLRVVSSHGLVYNGTAKTDGSFSVPVDGPIGETFTIAGTDSNGVPATSPAYPVNGAIVNVDPVTTLTAQPSTATPGTPVTIAVRLAAPAHTGGTPVALSSSNAAIAVPATITVPAGATTASVNVTAGDPGASTTVTINATSAGVTQSASVSITSANSGLTSISITPSSVSGGATATGTVTLGGPAPAGGAMVVLSSSSASVASVPSTIVVPAGSTNATFTMNALQAGSATITGTYGATQQTTVTVTSCGTMPAAAPATISPQATVWIDDSLPAGVTLTGGTRVSSQAASGTSSIQLSGSGPQSLALSGLSQAVASGDNVFVHALVNPCNPPRQILVIWNDGTSDYRASWGENVVDTTIDATTYGPMIAGGSWIRLDALASQIGAAGKTIKNVTIKTYGGEAYFDVFGKSACAIASPVAAPSLSAADVVWFDDAIPAGATPNAISGNGQPWTWTSTQVASGTSSHTDGLHAGSHEHYFIAAPKPFAVNNGDVIVTYVLIDPCNPPREIMLQFHSANSWEHRAYWGEDLLNWGTEGIPARYRMAPVPAAGAWVRLEVPAALVGLEGASLDGISFDAYDGQVWWDRTGTAPRVNLALNKPATQSTTLPVPGSVDGNFAFRAVDGNTNGNYNQADGTHTTNEYRPWWQVDLGAVQAIQDIQVWNRTDCCTDRLSNYWLLVSDTPFVSGDLDAVRNQAGVSAYYIAPTSPPMQNFRVNRTGRYVRVQLGGQNYLSLAEVQVWAPVSATVSNFAGGMHASASSQYGDGNPLNAVNGDLDAAYNQPGGISHTNGQTDPHWDVDLGASKPLGSVEVDMRTDCAWIPCTEQWPNFYVFVSDQPFTSDSVAATIAQPGVGTWYHGSARLNTVSFPVNRTGRYVRVARAGAGQIVTLNEVQVWSGAPSLQPLAVTQPTQ
jgi:Bacterial Ig-like domain/F5/8 type C domain